MVGSEQEQRVSAEVLPRGVAHQPEVAVGVGHRGQVSRGLSGFLRVDERRGQRQFVRVKLRCLRPRTCGQFVPTSRHSGCALPPFEPLDRGLDAIVLVVAEVAEVVEAVVLHLRVVGDLADRDDLVSVAGGRPGHVLMSARGRLWLSIAPAHRIKTREQRRPTGRNLVRRRRRG